MKTWSKFLAALVLLSLVSRGMGAPATGAAADRSAIEAIRQAADPSSVIAAYGSGIAAGPNDPAVYDAYVSRMVELGMPELAYRQAQTLTTLQSNNGIGWSVLAYVEARRGEMPEAVSAINLAGQLAPGNSFVQRTAGEILAWYDVKGNEAALPDTAKEGLAKVRAQLATQPAFAEAYGTAKKAYEAQASVSQESPTSTAAVEGSAPVEMRTQAEPGTSTATIQYPPASYAASYGYPDYYYSAGPGWVQPWPWYWWQPVGYFSGVTFTPFLSVVVFDHHKHFLRHHHQRHGFHSGFHGRFHNGKSFPGPIVDDKFFHKHPGEFFVNNKHDRVFWHNNGLDGGNRFFGAPARPNPKFAQSARLNLERRFEIPRFEADRTAVATRDPVARTRTPFAGTIPRLERSPGSLAPTGRPSAPPTTVQPTPRVQSGIAGRTVPMIQRGQGLQPSGRATMQAPTRATTPPRTTALVAPQQFRRELAAPQVRPSQPTVSRQQFAPPVRQTTPQFRQGTAPQFRQGTAPQFRQGIAPQFRSPPQFRANMAQPQFRPMAPSPQVRPNIAPPQFRPNMASPQFRANMAAPQFRSQGGFTRSTPMMNRSVPMRGMSGGVRGAGR